MVPKPNVQIRTMFICLLVVLAAAGFASATDRATAEDEGQHRVDKRTGSGVRGGGSGRVHRCEDYDNDGHADAACGGDDCNDNNDAVFPGATDTCNDGIDQDCNGADATCVGLHAALTWNGPGTCLACHSSEARDVHGSVMYQWQGETPYMVNGQPPQGKAAGAVNSYCINILGNWQACGSCHIGLGAPPEAEATQEQLRNIDCLICHQEGYRRTRSGSLFVPDEANMSMTMDQAVRTVHSPTRATCLQCHAKAGGGDAVKRGDLTLAHATTTDRQFDVHMATTGADLRCQQCHTVTDHRFAGKGSDLRPTDSAQTVECSRCHSRMAAGGHDDERIDRHVARVACQTCHIPIYAKDAADSDASEATETHRTWLATHSTSTPYHPVSERSNDLIPNYHFWNRYSDNALLGDVANLDPETGRYPTSRPLGAVGDDESKLYPFKFKTALQPIANRTGQLIALDTSVFFASADAIAATEQGLVNMGLDASEPYSWVETDTLQLLNHEVGPAEMALECADCHASTLRMDLQGKLGYALKGPQQVVCTQCHGLEDKGASNKDDDSEDDVHAEHVDEERLDCSWCHGFSRPERGLRRP